MLFPGGFLGLMERVKLDVFSCPDISDGLKGDHDEDDFRLATAGAGPGFPTTFSGVRQAAAEILQGLSEPGGQGTRGGKRPVITGFHRKNPLEGIGQENLAGGSEVGWGEGLFEARNAQLRTEVDDQAAGDPGQAAGTEGRGQQGALVDQEKVGYGSFA
jgi:hypothetical protein